MEFDSGGNDVRIRTGKTLGLGKAPLIGVRRDSNVSSDKNQNQKALILGGQKYLRFGSFFYFNSKVYIKSSIVSAAIT